MIATIQTTRHYIYKLALKLGGISILGSTVFIGGCGQEDGTDPLIGDFKLDVPIAYVKRPLDALEQLDDNGNLQPGNANPRIAHQYKRGGNLYIRPYAAKTAPEYNITASLTAVVRDQNGDVVTPAGDVSDPDVSYDGTRIVFAYKKGEPDNPQPDEETTWNLMEYILPTDTDGNVTDVTQGVLQRVIPDDLEAEKGNDIDPTYLPDGRIVFASDRIRSKVQDYLELRGGNIADDDNELLDESNRNPVFNLHSITPGNSDSIKQISFNQSNELDPALISVNDDPRGSNRGIIVYSRWEHAYAGEGNSPFPLFRVNPDGTDPDVLYGAHSFSNMNNGGPAALLQTRQMQNGKLIATIMPRFGTYLSGNLVIIDHENFIDNGVPRPNGSGGTAQVTLTNVTMGRGNSYDDGRYTTPFPLWDNTGRVLVAHAPCEVQDASGNRRLCRITDNYNDPNIYDPAPPSYGIWMYDPATDTKDFIILPDAGSRETITDPVALINRLENGDYPDVSDKQFGVNEGELDQRLIEINALGEEVPYGLVKISSVYDAEDLSAVGLARGQMRNIDNDRDGNTPTEGIDDELYPCINAGTVEPCAAGLTTAPVSDFVPFYQQQTPDARPARFIRVVSPSFVIDGNNSQNFREIVGYHVVEPDGSVVMRVPANRPFALEVVDKYGRKFRHHPNWLQVTTGDTIECHGCHEGHSTGTALNQGAANAVAFPGTDTDNSDGDLAPVPEVGETMAETRDRVSCDDTTGPFDGLNSYFDGCEYRWLSGDLVYMDFWNDPDNSNDPYDPLVVTPNAGFRARYQELNPPINPILSIPVMIGNSPSQANQADYTNNSCLGAPANWQRNCRIKMDYVEHIHPLWEKDRSNTDRGAGPEDLTCTLCHSDSFDNMGVITPMVPDGQLTLTQSGLRSDGQGNNQYNSYIELTEGDQVQAIINNALAYVDHPAPTQDDPTNTRRLGLGECLNFVGTYLGNDPSKCGSGNSVNPSNAAGNRNDGFLVNKLTVKPTAAQIANGAFDHTNILNDTELRMIIEWQDLDARYYGDPFDVP